MRRAFRSLWRASTLGSTDYLLGRSSQHFSQYPVFSFSRTMASTSSHGDPEFTNRLALEKSPYLLQHKHNPIEWFPWGEEAFEKARLLDRPIFLSVGYSTCHWCHVMEKESFENKATAKILNDNFVAIKVDREERPDVDKLYMAFIQSISGSGGWPMSVFLTPDLEPFTGGTYFPPEDVYGRPGFPKILNLIANMWRNERNKVVNQGKLVLKAIAQTAESPATSGSLPSLRSVIMTSLQHKISSYDGTHGGFGGAPKFPKVSDLEFLLNCSVWRGEDVTNAEREKSRSMLSKTLHSIAQGGIRDHVHGGFHRYSVDKEWHVPHFEKMLYDEAQLLAIYSDFYQAYGGNAIKDVICTTADYIKDSLTHKEGGFYSAEDADSYPTNDRVQKKEGAAYAWKREDFEEVLDDSLEKLLPGRNKEISLINLLCMYYDIKMGGNVAEESDPHGDLKGLNVLKMQSSHQAFATMFEVSPENLRSFLQEVHKRIKPKRLATVPRPHLDSKIVTAWQGLMISGYAKASAALVEQAYEDAALKAVDFVNKYLVAENGDLLRTVYRNDDDQIVQISHPIAAFSDDYAFMIQGLLDLYEINGDVSLLKWADELQTKMDTKFYDAEKKRGYYISEESMRSGVKVRTIEDQDGAEPCANSVAVNNLIRFADLLDDDKRRDRAHELIMSSSQILQKYSFVLCKMISGYKRMADGSAKIVIVGEKNNEIVKQFIKKVNESYIWNKAVVHIDPSNKEDVSYLSSRHALYGEMSQQKEPSVFICDMFACGLPIRSLEELDEKLKKLANISE